jgi:thiol:disulfide interchange protein DsbD
MLGFSTAFASPFFVLALFPKMLKRLPKSGGWMNDVKVVIGLVEIAAVVKFLSVSDIGFSVGQIPVYLTYDVFLWLWIAIGLITGIYLLGFFRKPKPAFSAIRGISALAFLLFSGRLIAGLYSTGLPADPIWNLVAAFAPPDVEVRKTADLGYVIAHHKLDFAMEFERAVSVATKDQQPLFLDFTGVNCVNCRQMERTVMIEENVVAAMKKMVRAQLYTDLVPGITDVELREKLLLLNQELQSELTGDVALPSYAVVSADGKKVLAYFSGLDSSGGEKFLEFLNAGLERWESMKPETAKSQHPANGPDVVLNEDPSLEN